MTRNIIIAVVVVAILVVVVIILMRRSSAAASSGQSPARGGIDPVTGAPWQSVAEYNASQQAASP